MLFYGLYVGLCHSIFCLEGEDGVVEKVSVRDKVQDLYKWGAALGIFWGLAVALLDILLRSSPIGQHYLNMLTSFTTPIYEQIALFTSKSPILLWLSNTLIALMYVVIGYGVKVTSTAIGGLWTVVFQKISQK